MMALDLIAAFCMIALPVTLSVVQLREFSREHKQR